MSELELREIPSFLRLYGEASASALMRKLRGDASTRAYYRIEVASPPAGLPSACIVMHLPADSLRSDEATGAAKPTELPFLNVHRALGARGVPVPKILAEDVPNRVLLLEDLGDETFEARLRARGDGEKLSLYGAAVDLLADLHVRMGETDVACIAYGRSFDAELLSWELDHFREWGVEALVGEISAGDRATFDRTRDALVQEIVAMPQGFVHRDYQSRNLMWVGERLVVIDFQDALLGPRVYDLVALLCDSYVVLSEEEQRTLIARYAARRGIDAKVLEREFWRVALQRKLKDAGRFVFIDRVRKNPDFLRSFPQSMAYAARALSHLPAYAELGALIARKVAGFPGPVGVPSPAPRDR